MSKRLPILTLLVLAAAAPGRDARGDEASTYLTEKGGNKELKEPLTVREVQSGITGLTGTLFTIEPSGRWKVERFRSAGAEKEHLTPLRSGTLTPDQLDSLAKALAESDLAGLAAKAGQEPKVNPHRVTIKFGEKASTFEGLPPRRGKSTLADLVRGAAAADAQATRHRDRFADLVKSVEQYCQEPAKP